MQLYSFYWPIVYNAYYLSLFILSTIYLQVWEKSWKPGWKYKTCGITWKRYSALAALPRIYPRRQNDSHASTRAGQRSWRGRMTRAMSYRYGSSDDNHVKRVKSKIYKTFKNVNIIYNHFRIWECHEKKNEDKHVKYCLSLSWNKHWKFSILKCKCMSNFLATKSVLRLTIRLSPGVRQD